MRSRAARPQCRGLRTDVRQEVFNIEDVASALDLDSQHVGFHLHSNAAEAGKHRAYGFRFERFPSVGSKKTKRLGEEHDD